MIGRIIGGKYTITELVGTGGMANVYKAVDTESRRTVAIKALKEEYLEDQEFVRRFEREAQAVMSLSHDNVVRSIDVFSEDGAHYIALEYVEGKTVKELLREEGKFEPRRAIHISTQVLDALTHAHERSIIHRDIKLQNILINPRGRVKLADFGIARDVSSSTVTFGGDNVLGSVHYISPEQARGERVDAKSDIYSLGISLYEMVTGVLPFTGDTNVAVALKHINEAFVPPIELVPDLPRSLNDIILRATNKDPAYRYSSAREMKQDLLRALREPNGRFVKLEQPASTPSPKLSSAKTPLRIALMLFIAIGLIMVVFLIAKNAIDSSRRQEQLYVPQLIGRLELDAIEYGSRQGFVIEIGQRVIDEGSAQGIVIDQSIDPGTPASKGDKVTITISEGPTVLTVPDLTGLTLDQATAALDAEGLLVGDIIYELADVPQGTVIRQYPVGGQELVSDEPISLWINDDPANHTEVPSLTGLSLDEALLFAHERGFDDIFVRETDAGETNELEGTVLNQSPLADEIATRATPIELTVSRVVQRDYFADVAFNLEIELPNTRIMVAFEESGGAKYIVYDEVLPPGAQTVSVQIESNDEKDKTVIVYEDGQEMRRVTKPVTPKTQ